MLRGRLPVPRHRLHDADHLEAVTRGEVEERPVEGRQPPPRPRLRLAPHVHVYRLDRAPQRAPRSWINGAPGGSRPESASTITSTARCARTGSVQKWGSIASRADHPGRRQDRVHERAQLEDTRLARARAPREPLRPRVESQPDREDEAGVLEPDHVLRARLVVVRVEPPARGSAGPRAGRPRHAARGHRWGTRWRRPGAAPARCECRRGARGTRRRSPPRPRWRRRGGGAARVLVLRPALTSFRELRSRRRSERWHRQLDGDRSPARRE